MTATRRTGATPRGQPQPQGRHATYTRTTIQTRCRAPRTLLGSGAWSPRVGAGNAGARLWSCSSGLGANGQGWGWGCLEAEGVLSPRDQA